MLVPLADRPRWNAARPWATWGLAAVLALAFLAALGSPAGPDGRPPLAEQVRRYGFDAAAPLSRTLWTHLGVHGSALHLLGNLLFLGVFGPNVERRLGPVPFLLLFLVCGAVGALAFRLSAPGGVLIGASGAALGVCGFHAVGLPRQRVLVLAWLLVVWVGEVPSRLLVALLLLLDLGALWGTGYGGGWGAVPAHLGGLACGGLAALALGRSPGASRRGPGSL